jgi:hypothetical protein
VQLGWHEDFGGWGWFSGGIGEAGVGGFVPGLVCVRHALVRQALLVYQVGRTKHCLSIKWVGRSAGRKNLSPWWASGPQVGHNKQTTLLSARQQQFKPGNTQHRGPLTVGVLLAACPACNTIM